MFRLFVKLGCMAHTHDDDKRSILSRREFLIRSALLGAGVTLAASQAQADTDATDDVMTSDADASADGVEVMEPEPEACLSIARPEDDCSCSIRRTSEDGLTSGALAMGAAVVVGLAVTSKREDDESD